MLLVIFRYLCNLISFLADNYAVALLIPPVIDNLMLGNLSSPLRFYILYGCLPSVANPQLAIRPPRPVSVEHVPYRHIKNGIPGLLVLPDKSSYSVLATVSGVPG